MGYIDVSGVSYSLADGRPLLDDVSFRVGEGSVSALIGANGAGKSTLLRIIRGDIKADTGSIGIDGGLGVMDQFVGHVRDERTVRDLLVSVAPTTVRRASEALSAAEDAIIERDETDTQLAYATALAEYADAGGYDHEVVWDHCTIAALGIPFERAQFRSLRSLSGGEQKRLALEALLRGPERVLLLDEPDNYLDVPAKRWLEEQLRATPKTVLLVSRTIGSFSRTPPIASSRSNSAPLVTVYGRTAAASAAISRPATTGWPVWRSCGVAGMRSRRSSRLSYCACGRRRSTTAIWRPPTAPRRLGWRSSRRRDRPNCDRASRTSPCG